MNAMPIQNLKPEEIHSRIEEIFREIFDDGALQLKRELTSSHVPGWDSVSNVRLVFSVEEAFDIRFSIEEVMKMENAGSLIDAVSAKLC
jgi:acyl carrier protein